MGLTKEDYDKIKRTYDQRQLDALYHNDKYLEKLYTSFPRLKAIKDELSSLQVIKIKGTIIPSILGNHTINDIDKQINFLMQERSQIYLNNNIKEEDLLPKYICKDCNDTGFISPGVHCHCFNQAVINALYSKSNITSLLTDNNFNSFNYNLFDNVTIDSVTNKTARQNIKEAVLFSKQFINEFENKKRNILLYGDTGVGKTFLTNCIAKELLLKSFSVLYLSAIDFSHILTEVSFSIGNTNPHIKAQADLIFSCDLLIIDDLGTEVTNSLKTSNLFNCLEKRLTSNKPIIISTNLSPKQINQQYSERIFSRIIGNFTCFKIFGSDLRYK